MRDIFYGARLLARNPGFTLVCVLTLALGIGANTSIFSFVNAWVLRPLPYTNPDRLTVLSERDTKKGWNAGVTAADFIDWREHSGIFEQIGAYANASFNLTGVNEPERLRGARVTHDFFRVLGVAPVEGRDFLAHEDQPGEGRVVILSHELWENRFGADGRLTGKTITLDGEPFTVLGIMPKGFHLPIMGRVNLWTPLALSASQRANRSNHSLGVLARLKPGVDLPHARNAMNGLADRLAKDFPQTNTHIGVRLVTLHDEIGRHAGNEPVLITFAIVGCILLIACANVANLMLARATSRRREMAVRLAIGAGRLRLIRQLLTENLLLFLIAACLGIAFSFWGVDWITSSIPLQNRGYLRDFGVVTVDFPTLAFTLAIAIVSGLLFGLAPALEGSKSDLNATLKQSAGRGSGGLSGQRMRKIFVISEIALTLIVLVAASLLMQSFIRMFRVDPGFNTERLLTAQVDLPASKYAVDIKADSGMPRVESFFVPVIEKIAALPRVAGVGASQHIPFGGSGSRASFYIEGRPRPAPSDLPLTQFTAVTAGYLAAMRIPLKRGRLISEQDGANSPRVAVINETMAQRYWPRKSADSDSLGRRIRLERGSQWMTIVGIVKDVKLYDLAEPVQSQVYIPFAQSPARSMNLVVRTKPGPGPVAAAIRSSVWDVDKDQPISRIVSMEQLIGDVNAPYLILTKLMGFFAGLALFLAAIGIYGVMAYAVSTRTHEIGIRMALGAEVRGVLALVTREGMTFVAIGLLAGIAGAFVFTRVLANLLFQVKPGDPLTFTLAGALLAMVSLLACLIPARRAARIDPVVSLRYD